MNSIEKLGVGLAGILVIIGIAYYSLPNIGGSSAFGPTAGPIPAGPTDISCDIYVADSSIADDLNDGLTLQTPVRTIRRSVDVANTCKIANIRFLGDDYNVLASDMITPQIGNKIEIGTGGLVELIDISPNKPTGNYRIYINQIGLSDRIAFVDSIDSGQTISISIHGFVFDELGLLNRFNSDVRMVYGNNVFNIMQQGGLDLIFADTSPPNTNLNIDINDNIFNVEATNRPAINMYIGSPGGNEVTISANEFIFSKIAYEGDSAYSDTNGINIIGVKKGSNVDIFDNHFSLELGYLPQNITKSLSGISIYGPQSTISIFDNTFSIAGAMRVVIGTFPIGSVLEEQFVIISGNKEVY